MCWLSCADNWAQQHGAWPAQGAGEGGRRRNGASGRQSEAGVSALVGKLGGWKWMVPGSSP